MEIILPSTGKRVHVGVIKSMYIYMHLYLSRHFLASSIFKSFSRSRMIHNVGMVAAFGLIVIAGLTITPFSSSSLNAAPGTANPSNTTLTMVLSHENAELAILPSATSGTFGTSTDAETAKFNVTTDNFTGYTLSLKGTDDTRQLVNTTTSSVLDSITTTTTAAAFDTDTYNNKWGFLPSKYDSAANTDYIPAPTTTTVTTLDATNTANSTAVDYSLGLGVRIDINKPAGDYTNTFVLTAVGNPIHYVVNFNKNTTDSVDDMPVALDASTTATSIKIPSTTPTRAHYAFTGWCLGTTSTTDGVDTCTDGASGSGTVFQPGDDFGIDQTTANTTTLYAMWRIDTVTVTLTAGTGIDTVAITGSGVKTGGAAGATSTAEVYYNGEITITATPTITYAFTDWTGDDTYTDNPQTIANVTADTALTANAEQLTIMQNLSASECTATPKLVADNRDGETYTIQRLADGKCWLLDNLRLDLSTVSLENLKGNTNASNQSLTYLKNGGGTSPYAVSGVAAKTPDGGTFPSSHTAPYIATSYKNTIGSEKWGVGSGKDGIYYNYCAASAGSYCYGSGSGTGNAVYDICPAGWHMPTTDATNNGSYNYLYTTAYSANQANFKTALSAVLSGVIVDDAFALQNQYGRYWSATFKDTNNMHDLRTTASAVDIAYAVRDRGFSVRCVMDDTVVMQNIDSTTLDSLVPSSGNSVTLKDIRDGEKYTVTKLADGNVWMTQNLRFTGTELTPEDTNVDSNITMSYGSLSGSGADSYDDAKILVGTNYVKGVWYNYAAATAGTITGSSNSNNATQDICPAGWRLPTHDEETNIVSYTSQFTPSNGGYYISGAPNATTYGYWWPSTSYDATKRYLLGYNGTSLNVTTYNNGRDRQYGFFIRCIYDKSVDMQNISQSAINSLVPTTGSTTTLKDTRDGELYTVSKLADGTIWMIQDLRFTGTELTPADSNVVSNITMTYGADLSAGDSVTEPRMHPANTTTHGVWYNYTAASAGTVNTSADGNEAVQSICPAGWRLPTQTEIAAVVSNSTGFNPSTGGVWSEKSLQYTGWGMWWSATANGTTNRYRLDYNSATSGSKFSSNLYDRLRGVFVRCVYDKTPVMQNIDNATLNSLVPSAGNSTILKDARDGKRYTVTKLGNGSIWMTQNLGFTGDTMDSTTSNISSEYTPSNPYRVNNGSGYIDVGTTTNTSYEVAGIHDSHTDTNGVWYNHAAASAGTVTTASDLNNTEYDVCPAGWRLPTHTELSNVKSYLTQFNPVTGGFYSYNSTSINSSSYGYWITSTPDEDTTRFFSYYNGSTLVDSTRSYRLDRKSATYIRCIYNGPEKTMQNFTSTDSYAMAAGNTRVLADARDGKKYTVTKLSDGRVWMTQNLAFTGTELTSADSNVSENKTISWTSGITTDNASAHYQDSGNSTNGVWYNYAGVTAGEITGTTSTTNSTMDICPRGWRLPTRTEISAMTGYMSQFNPIAGRYHHSTYMSNPVFESNIGSWWSSDANTNASYTNSRYALDYRNNTITLGATGYYLYNGYSVRCIFNEANNISQISTMQQFAALSPSEKTNVLASMTANQAYTLPDVRDNKQYTIAKINGNVWMTQNLRFTESTVSPETSNVSSETTIPWGALNDGYTEPSYYDSGRTDYGVLYNYAGLSALTITGANNSEALENDICPKGWKLPSMSQYSTVTSYSSAFGPVKSGAFSGTAYGVGYVGTYGYWWTSDVTANTDRNFFWYSGSALRTDHGGRSRYYATAVRCILK